MLRNGYNPLPIKYKVTDARAGHTGNGYRNNLAVDCAILLKFGTLLP